MEKKFKKKYLVAMLSVLAAGVLAGYGEDTVAITQIVKVNSGNTNSNSQSQPQSNTQSGIQLPDAPKQQITTPAKPSQPSEQKSSTDGKAEPASRLTDKTQNGGDKKSGGSTKGKTNGKKNENKRSKSESSARKRKRKGKGKGKSSKNKNLRNKTPDVKKESTKESPAVNQNGPEVKAPMVSVPSATGAAQQLPLGNVQQPMTATTFNTQEMLKDPAVVEYISVLKLIDQARNTFNSNPEYVLAGGANPEWVQQTFKLTYQQLRQLISKLQAKEEQEAVYKRVAQLLAGSGEIDPVTKNTITPAGILCIAGSETFPFKMSTRVAIQSQPAFFDDKAPLVGEQSKVNAYYGAVEKLRASIVDTAFGDQRLDAAKRAFIKSYTYNGVIGNNSTSGDALSELLSKVAYDSSNKNVVTEDVSDVEGVDGYKYEGSMDGFKAITDRRPITLAVSYLCSDFKNSNLKKLVEQLQNVYLDNTKEVYDRVTHQKTRVWKTGVISKKSDLEYKRKYLDGIRKVLEEWYKELEKATRGEEDKKLVKEHGKGILDFVDEVKSYGDDQVVYADDMVKVIDIFADRVQKQLSELRGSTIPVTSSIEKQQAEWLAKFLVKAFEGSSVFLPSVDFVKSVLLGSREVLSDVRQNVVNDLDYVAEKLTSSSDVKKGVDEFKEFLNKPENSADTEVTHLEKSFKRMTLDNKMLSDTIRNRFKDSADFYKNHFASSVLTSEYYNAMLEKYQRQYEEVASVFDYVKKELQKITDPEQKSLINILYFFMSYNLERLKVKESGENAETTTMSGKFGGVDQGDKFTKDNYTEFFSNVLKQMETVFDSTKKRIDETSGSTNKASVYMKAVDALKAFALPLYQAYVLLNMCSQKVVDFAEDKVQKDESDRRVLNFKDVFQYSLPSLKDGGGTFLDKDALKTLLKHCPRTEWTVLKALSVFVVSSIKLASMVSLAKPNVDVAGTLASDLISRAFGAGISAGANFIKPAGATLFDPSGGTQNRNGGASYGSLSIMLYDPTGNTARADYNETAHYFTTFLAQPAVNASMMHSAQKLVTNGNYWRLFDMFSQALAPVNTYNLESAGQFKTTAEIEPAADLTAHNADVFGESNINLADASDKVNGSLPKGLGADAAMDNKINWAQAAGRADYIANSKEFYVTYLAGILDSTFNPSRSRDISDYVTPSGGVPNRTYERAADQTTYSTFNLTFNLPALIAYNITKKAEEINPLQVKSGDMVKIKKGDGVYVNYREEVIWDFLTNPSNTKIKAYADDDFAPEEVVQESSTTTKDNDSDSQSLIKSLLRSRKSLLGGSRSKSAESTQVNSFRGNLFGSRYGQNNISTSVGSRYSQNNLSTSFGSPYSQNNISTSFGSPYSQNNLSTSFGSPYSQSNISTSVGNAFPPGSDGKFYNKTVSDINEGLRLNRFLR